MVKSKLSSSIATISLDSGTGTIKAVYKFVPLFGKYIQVTDGVVIAADKVTMQTQADATYYVKSVPMDSAETVTQGWVKADNNWYMLNNTGDNETGWQQDSNRWVYLSPKDGVMQTGWYKDGDTWYYLSSNGYMKTGWVYYNNYWYYLNPNGSMASNTVIDGYTLDASGACVS